ncbi:MAG TPA: class I SAM-dependent methyltransferase [Acidothermaceae bacterium]|nr:class I SAM-dependent methyltransferase [Acidothermaceae bacterium]
MNERSSLGSPPPQLAAIEAVVQSLGFSMSCDSLTGELLRALAASKPGSRILELGTGAGTSTAWLLAGMSPDAALTTVENDPQLIAAARHVLSGDSRVRFVEQDGADFLRQSQGEHFALIFADTWPGKFEHLDEALALLDVGGIYIVDDLNPQPQWPAGHAPKVPILRQRLHSVPWLSVVELHWSTGLMIGTRAW